MHQKSRRDGEFNSRHRVNFNGRHARVVIDTSGVALKQAGLGIYLLKPSLRELMDLTGLEIRTERDQELAARQIIEQGRCEILVLSLGAQGALLATSVMPCRRLQAPG